MATNPAIMTKLANPGPATKGILDEWNKYFKDSKYVGHGSTSTGGSAYAKFSVPAVHPTKLVRVPVRVGNRHYLGVSSLFNETWDAWAKLRAESMSKDPIKIRTIRDDFTNSWNDQSTLRHFLSEMGLHVRSSPAPMYESFFTFVGMIPEMDRAIRDISSSSLIQDKKKNHEINTALCDIRNPLRTLLRHGIEREQIRDMIDEEIVRLITEG